MTSNTTSKIVGAVICVCGVAVIVGGLVAAYIKGEPGWGFGGGFMGIIMIGVAQEML